MNQIPVRSWLINIVIPFILITSSRVLAAVPDPAWATSPERVDGIGPYFLGSAMTNIDMSNFKEGDGLDEFENYRVFFKDYPIVVASQTRKAVLTLSFRNEGVLSGITLIIPISNTDTPRVARLIFSSIAAEYSNDFWLVRNEVDNLGWGNYKGNDSFGNGLQVTGLGDKLRITATLPSREDEAPIPATGS